MAVIDRFSAIKGPKKSGRDTEVIIMGNQRGLFLGGRYVHVTAIQRWPLSRFDCTLVSCVIEHEYFTMKVKMR